MKGPGILTPVTGAHEIVTVGSVQCPLLSRRHWVVIPVGMCVERTSGGSGGWVKSNSSIKLPIGAITPLGNVTEVSASRISGLLSGLPAAPDRAGRPP